jgi:predicted enzyme related to lactoylglutathione lyase
VAIRSSWLGELGLMAVRPAFGSPNVYSDWNRRPFHSASGGHVSVCRRPSCVANSEGRSNPMAGIARMRTIVLDCPDPQMLARFYGELLGWEVTYADDWVNLAGPGGKLSFQLAPDYVAPTWPDPKVPQQFHVDVTVDDVDAAEQAVLALGATKTEEQPGVPDGNWRVYLDPVGHPFCLCWD